MKNQNAYVGVKVQVKDTGEPGRIVDRHKNICVVRDDYGIQHNYLIEELRKLPKTLQPVAGGYI